MGKGAFHVDATFGRQRRRARVVARVQCLFDVAPSPLLFPQYSGEQFGPSVQLVKLDSELALLPTTTHSARLPARALGSRLNRERERAGRERNGRN